MSDGIQRQSRVVTDFRGDFDQLAKLMQASWSENPQQALLYTSRFLESFLHQPGADYALAPTVYDASTPIGFIAGIPRRLRYKGREWCIVVSTLLTVSPERKRTALGIALWSELVQRAQARGFDGMVNFCVDGEPMNAMIPGCCQRLHLPVEQVFSISYLTNMIPTKAKDEQLSTHSDVTEEFLATAAGVSAAADIGRCWTPDEVRWQYSREGVVAAHFRAGSRFGMLTGYIMALTDANHTRTLLVEDVLWGSLAPEEKTALVKALTARASALGARIATVPILGYADMEPFRAARFRPSARKVQTYLTLWSKDSPHLERVNSIYLDVF